MKYYDDKNKRLIIFQEKANPEFWVNIGAWMILLVFKKL